MENIIKARDFINSKTNNFKPDIAIILGSGLGNLPEKYNCVKLEYADIPYFQKPSIEGHKGQLCFCEAEGKKIVMMQGRYHYYEGYTMQQITFPIKVFKSLGINTVILTNAAGTLSEELSPGDIMLIKDHINLMGDNPLIGKNDNNFGERFPDMSDVYNKLMREKIKDISQNCNIDLKEGVYIAMSGPSYETPSEVKMAKLLGANAIGMSTVPEAIVANYCNINVIGLSCITNYAAGVSENKLEHKEVIQTANMIEEKFQKLISCIIREI